MDRRTLAIMNRMCADLMLSYVTDYRYEDMEHLRRTGAIGLKFPGPFMHSINRRLATLDMETISQTGVPFITELYNTFAELAFPYTYKSVPMLFFLGILMGTRVEPYLPYPGTAGYQSFNNAAFGCYQGLDLPGTTGCVRPLFTNSHIQLNRKRIWVHGKSITDNNSKIPWATADSPVTVADLRHYRFLNHFVRLETVSEPTTTCPSARLPLAPRPALSTLMSTGARPPTSAPVIRCTPAPDTSRTSTLNQKERRALKRKASVAVKPQTTTQGGAMSGGEMVQTTHEDKISPVSVSSMTHPELDEEVLPLYSSKFVFSFHV